MLPVCLILLCITFRFYYSGQRWSLWGRPWPRGRPRGQILKSLASKVKSLASRPQVLENWPVLGSRTALFFELLKFCEALEKFFGKRFFVETARKIFLKTFFFFLRSPKKFLWFWRALALVSLALASSIPVLGLGKAVLGLGLGFFCVLGLGLEPCVLDSTSDSGSA